MTEDRAQTLVGLGALAAIVVGPLALILPVFVYSPLDGRSWWSALGLGALVALVAVGGVVFLGVRGLLSPMQVAFGGGLLGVGLACFLAASALLANGLFDGAPPRTHRLVVDDFWRDCSTYRAQNSTTKITRCDLYARFYFLDGERPPLLKVEVPDGSILFPETVVNAEMRRGALGWSWGLTFDPSPPQTRDPNEADGSPSPDAAPRATEQQRATGQ